MSTSSAAAVERMTVNVQLPDGTEVEAGTLSNDRLGASQIPTPTFRYAPEYLTTRGAYALSPDLPLNTGPLRPGLGRTVLGAFGDAMPDDWGRKVMRRGGLRVTSDLDYLTNVRDRHRQGALRILIDGTPVAPDDGTEQQHTDKLLRRWMKAAIALDAGTESEADVEALVHAGTSAGGARPKVVIEHDSGLRIVKFPRSTELPNQMAWEGMALELARRAGADVPKFWVPKLGERLGLMVERFDRTSTGRRLGYISAHTLIQRRDNEISDYTTLVEEMVAVSESPKRDSEELFRRIALSILLNNVDDHMRNHGFLRRAKGWALAPLFDVEPQREFGRTDATPITPNSSGVDRDIVELFENAATFSVGQGEAARIIGEVELATRPWAEVAMDLGIHADQIPVWSKVFDGANRSRAKEIGERASHQPSKATPPKRAPGGRFGSS